MRPLDLPFNLQGQHIALTHPYCRFDPNSIRRQSLSAGSPRQNHLAHYLQTSELTLRTDFVAAYVGGTVSSIFEPDA
ncbi:MAG: hypothetical protein ABI561_17450 [Bradyrhizobium sp.]